MSDSTKKLIGWAVVVVAIIGAAFLGINFPVPPPPVDVGMVVERSGVGQPIKFDRAVTFAQPVTMASDATVGDDLVVTGDLTVSGTSTVTADPTQLEIGGGFSGGSGSVTGCRISAAGDVACDGAGYFRSTLGVTGAVTTTGALDVGTAVSAATAEIGGGFSGGSGAITGCSVTAAGDLYCDGTGYVRGTLGVTGAVTTTSTARFGGAVTADTRLNTGGGYGAGGGGTGCELSAAGDVECDGKAYFGGTLGVTGAVTTTGALDVGGALNYGTNNLYPIGHASTGKQIVAATVSTAGDGHATITHGLTGVDSVVVSLCQAPAAAAAFASAIITSTTVTLNAWDINMNNRVNGVSLCYYIIGTR